MSIDMVEKNEVVGRNVSDKMIEFLAKSQKYKKIKFCQRSKIWNKLLKLQC